MKFEMEEPEFRPVRITLETQEEVDVLHALLGMAPGNHADSLLYKLYVKLESSSNSFYRDYWEGRLTTKH